MYPTDLRDYSEVGPVFYSGQKRIQVLKICIIQPTVLFVTYEKCV